MADRARSFGSRASDYAEHRPDYPADAVRWALGGASGPVLDLAAGTGKLTAGLLALGRAVTAVEPDDAMRAELSRRFPQVAALSGTAEAIPLASGAVDAVVVGQAFHWFDHAAALDEIGRVLRPGGTVGLLWNGEDESVEWVAGLLAIAETRVSSSAAEMFEVPPHPLFLSSEVAVFPHRHRRTIESLAATLGTHSRLIVSPAQERADVLRRVGEYLSGRPETASGTFDVPLVTKVVRAARV
jgi:SAM-dependent methyltransferase